MKKILLLEMVFVLIGKGTADLNLSRQADESNN